jgi:hypothetical protein
VWREQFVQSFELDTNISKMENYSIVIKKITPTQLEELVKQELGEDRDLFDKLI